MSSRTKSVGHPVEVASGTMWSEHQDLTIPGTFLLAWSRRYATDLLVAPPSPLGPGWTCPYFAALTRIGKDYHFRTPDGGTLVFQDPDDSVDHGKVVRVLGSFMELEKHGSFLWVTKWDVDSEDLVRYVFQPGRTGEFWPLRSLEDGTGMGLDLAWDAQGLLKGVRQKLDKRTLAVDHTSDGKLASVSFVSLDGRRKVMARYEYDAGGRLAVAYNAMEVAERYEYDAGGRMVRELARDGGVFSFKYDDRGRCVRITGLDRFDWKSLRYMDQIGWTEVTDSYGNVTRYQWLPSGQVVIEVDPLGAKTLTEYDSEGRIAKEIDPLGNATAFEYDNAGNRCKVTDPADAFVTLKYREGHLIEEVSDALGETWKRRYDQAGRMIGLEGPSGEKWTAAFDPKGLLLEVSAPTGAVRRFTYTANGVPLSQTDWKGNVTRFQVDDLGRTIARQDALGSTDRMTYDWLGNVMSVERPDGASFRFTYDDAGNTTSLVDENGNRTAYRYGTCLRLLEVVDPTGARRKYRWGTEPNMLIEVINEKGETHSLGHDAAGRVKTLIGFDGLKMEYEYDLEGNCVAIVWPSGARTKFEWGPSGLLTNRIGTDEAVSTFRYDRMGRMVAAANPFANLLLDRDAMGRIVREAQGGDEVLTEYDVLDNPVMTKTNLGYRVLREFDANGQMSAFETQEGGRVQIKRNGLGWETGRLFPKALALEQVWDARGNLQEQKLGATGLAVPIVRRSYQYDKVGNLSQVDDNRWGVSRYIHDPSDRLIQVFQEKLKGESFVFDDVGNLTSMAEGAETPEALEYAPGNRLLHRGSTRYEYDGDGRLIHRIEAAEGAAARVWSYAWDGDGNLASVTTPEDAEWRYSYDALGRRVAKEGPKTSFRYLWNRQVMIQEIEEDKVKSGWVHDPESFQLLCKLRDRHVYWAMNDQLGTARELVDASGVLAWAGDYKAWGGKGGAEEAPMTECPVRFQGQWEDTESGLHYNGFRYYDPDTGRYISPDPLGLEAGLNAYAYAPSPVNWIDPFGLTCTKKQEAQLKKDAKAIHAKFKKGDERNRRTTAVAILTDPKTGKQTRVFAVSSDRVSAKVRREAEKRGYTLVRMQEGGSTHAEQIVMDHAKANGVQSTIAPNRPACGPERQDCRGRADRSRNHNVHDPD